MQQALLNLQASLQRIRAIAADIDANAPAALASPDVRARHETTLAAATVILSGFLESFLRELAEDMTSEICSRHIPFASLPDSVRITHFLGGGAWLQQISKDERKLQPIAMSDSADVARRLNSVNNAQPPYELVWEAFAETQANPGSGAIREFLKRFDVKSPLPTLAAAINSTEAALSIRLSSFLEVRNECAHTGTTTSIITTSSLVGYCDLLDQVANGMLHVLQQVLANPPYSNIAFQIGSSPPPTPGTIALPSSVAASQIRDFLVKLLKRVIRCIQGQK